MSKPSGPSNAWSSTALKTQCKNQNQSILESGIPLQIGFKVDDVQCYAGSEVPERPKSEKAGEEGPLAERDKPL